MEKFLLYNCSALIGDRECSQIYDSCFDEKKQDILGILCENLTKSYLETTLIGLPLKYALMLPSRMDTSL